MLLADRGDFEKQFAILCAGFDRRPDAERQEAFWKGLAKMSSLQFARSIERILQNMEGRRLTVGEVWSAHRELRARVPIQVTEQRQSESLRDQWEAVAGKHLLGFISHKCKADPKYFGDPGAATFSHLPHASEETRRKVMLFVAAKNAWVDDMVSIGNRVEPEIQMVCWNDYMTRAQRQMAALI